MHRNSTYLASPLAIAILAIAAPAQAEEANLIEAAAVDQTTMSSGERMDVKFTDASQAMAMSAALSAQLAPLAVPNGTTANNGFVQFNLAQTTSFGPSDVSAPVVRAQSISATPERLQTLAQPHVQTAIRFDLDRNAQAAFGDEIKVEEQDRFANGRLDDSVILNRPIQFRAPAQVQLTL